MPRKRKYRYSVQRKQGNTTRVMKSFPTKKEATKYYNAHPRAVYIQRFTNGVSSGMFQPGVKEKVRHRKKYYQRAYSGPFTKRDAEAHVRSINKRGNLHAIKKKLTKGWFVYVR